MLFKIDDIKFSNVLYKKYHFLMKNNRSFCSAKAPLNFLAKNNTAIDFMSTVRLNKSLINNFIKLTML